MWFCSSDANDTSSASYEYESWNSEEYFSDSGSLEDDELENFHAPVNSSLGVSYSVECGNFSLR